MQPSRTIRFLGCRVEVWDDLRCLQTVFPDGSYVPAAPQDDPAYLARALELGYGGHLDPAWAMCLEHEVLHTWAAEKRGLPHSPTLWYVAHGKQNRPDDVDWEEHVVCMLQKAVNGRDKYEESAFLAPTLNDGIIPILLEARALCRGGPVAA